MSDKVILGISQCKSFYIVTEEEASVKRFIMNYLSAGVTVLDARGGYTNNHQKVIMCIVTTKDYFLAKEGYNCFVTALIISGFSTDIIIESLR